MFGTRRLAMRGAAIAVLLSFLSVSAALGPAAAQTKDVIILAAASLKNALDEASAAWTKESGKTAKISYAASSALAKQVESGIPADIFISADIPWMDYVAERKLIKMPRRFDFLSNQMFWSPARTPRPN